MMMMMMICNLLTFYVHNYSAIAVQNKFFDAYIINCDVCPLTIYE